MAELLLLNPRKRKAKKRKGKMPAGLAAYHAKRKSAKRRRNPIAVSGVSAKARKRYKFKGRKRNPIASTRGALGAVTSGLVAGAGALSLDVVMGYLPLPDAINTPTIKPVVKAGVALGLGLVLEKIIGREKAALATTGMMAVIAHGVMRDVVSTAAPSIRLAGYETPMLGNLPPVMLPDYSDVGGEGDGNDAYALNGMDEYGRLVDSMGGYTDEV